MRKDIYVFGILMKEYEKKDCCLNRGWFYITWFNIFLAYQNIIQKKIGL